MARRVRQPQAAATYRHLGKRCLDLLLIIGTAWLTLPLLAAVTAVVITALGRPVFFRQRRPGLHGVPFTMLKFRTMTDERDARGNLLPDQRRLTRIGRFLRSTSLDELPELINVCQGTMSLVGPRPLLMEYLDLYTPEQSRRHEVRPGITGLAQVRGRNALSWEEKFAFDVWYVDHLSGWLDLQILLQTVAATLGRRNINAPGSATAAKFRGSDQLERRAA